MAKEESLAQLKDIHLPASIKWWPLAPGWYVLLFVILFLASVLFFFLYKRQKHAKPRKWALELLRHYKQQYKHGENARPTSALISELLRRVALVYYPRDQVASLHGAEWIDFLNRTCKGIDFNSVQFMLVDLPFKSTEKIVDLNPLIIKAELWIKQRRVPCSS